MAEDADGPPRRHRRSTSRATSARCSRITTRWAAARWPFCWPGLLAPQAWFLYRKMYLWAALVSAGPLLIAYLPGWAYLDWGASLIGALGLRFYFAGAPRAIAAHSRRAPPARTRRAR